MEAKLDEALLESTLTKIETARKWSPRVIAKFEQFLRSADDYSLYYVNPIQFAKERGIAEDEALDLILHATRHGLFQIHWQLMCPTCGDRVRDFRTLRTLNAKYYCAFCQVETVASLDDFIEISFVVAPQLRPVAYHRPESLPIDDYCFRYRLHPIGHVRGITGRYVEIMREHAVGLSFIQPGERKEFSFSASRGCVIAHDFIHGASFTFPISEGAASGGGLSLVFADGAFAPAPPACAPGGIKIAVENKDAAPLAFLLLHFADEVPTKPLEFEPFLSGKRLLITKTYLDLFSADAAPSLEGIGVRDITILFTDLKGSTAMYDRIGDLKAFSLVRQHFDCLEKAIAGQGGVLVKTIGDAIMAAFVSPERGMEAALEMIREINRFNRALASEEQIHLKIGLHRGQAIAVALNGQCDYFGQMVNIAARVQGLADGDQICVTEDVHSSPEVQQLIRGHAIAAESARLKGVQEEMRVYRIRPG